MKAKHYVYFNLHKNCWSVKYRGKVIAHTDWIILKDAEYKVSAPGRERVLREKVKNVHAYVAGEWVTDTIPVRKIGTATYNPYKGPHFTSRETGKPIHEDAYVIMECKTGKPTVTRYL